MNSVPRRAPVFLDLSSEDPVSTRSFLENVFGCRFAGGPTSNGDGMAFETPEGHQGHVHPADPAQATEQIGRVRVADLESTLVQAQQAGGTLLMPRVDAPGMGSFFVVKIPGGPLLTCWQSAPRERVPRR